MAKIEGIDIDPKIVLEISNKISTIRSQIKSSLDSIKVGMDETEVYWKSDARTVLTENYENVKSIEDKFFDELNNYSVFLKEVASDYTDVDRKAKSVLDEIL